MRVSTYSTFNLEFGNKAFDEPMADMSSEQRKGNIKLRRLTQSDLVDIKSSVNKNKAKDIFVLAKELSDLIEKDDDFTTEEKANRKNQVWASAVSSSNEADSREVKKLILNKIIISWSGVFDSDDKEIPCNNDNKFLLFYDLFGAMGDVLIKSAMEFSVKFEEFDKKKEKSLKNTSNSKKEKSKE